jgi:hypothetical protein
MARIRSIKPEFWTDGNIVRLSPYARLLFIGAWNFALCDYGHVADDPERLRLQVLPSDPVDPVALLDELISNGRLTRIELSDGRTFLHIKRFEDHQRIEKRWTPRCPACLELRLEKPLTTSREPAQTPPSTRDLSGERRGEEGKKNMSTGKPVDERFQVFWVAYPRKVAKGAAVKAWGTAVKRGADPEKILAAAEAFAFACRGKDSEYVPHASTWLNQERYNDEPERAAPAEQPRRHLPLTIPDHIDPDDYEQYAAFLRGAAR